MIYKGNFRIDGHDRSCMMIRCPDSHICSICSGSINWEVLQDRGLSHVMYCPVTHGSRLSARVVCGCLECVNKRREWAGEAPLFAGPARGLEECPYPQRFVGGYLADEGDGVIQNRQVDRQLPPLKGGA